MCTIREDAPAEEVLAQVIKYDGGQEEPRWMDTEPSTTFEEKFFLSGTYNPKDRFETLCHVVADISAAPCTSKVGRFGKMCYTRKLDVVLLVGLTELKAQIRWIDSRTVRISWLILTRLVLLTCSSQT